ncbi:MAG: hypothetical protein ACI8RD_007991 [Bacillariaceae sp.]|jgi:hypothetical protein
MQKKKKEKNSTSANEEYFYETDRSIILMLSDAITNRAF